MSKGLQQGHEFETRIRQELLDTELAVSSISTPVGDVNQESWRIARELVNSLNPVPWFIWRISNFAFGTPGEVKQIPEGMIIGLRKLLLAAAADPNLGGATKTLSDKEALSLVSSDVFAACSVIHAVCRKLSRSPIERVWRPILEDALIRTQIGYSVGKRDLRFGAGRGMLAGFAGRIGLAILISSSDKIKAQKALECLAAGDETSKVGLAVFGCDPLQVSAMVLTAAGCGRDAAFGTVSYSLNRPGRLLDNQEQAEWLAAFAITENARMGTAAKLGEDTWEVLGFDSGNSREELILKAKQIARKGHSLKWLL